MASLFGHFTAGYGISKIIDKQVNRKILLLAMISSFLPDADVIAFSFDIPYEHWAGHRGFTHSILFAIIWGIFIGQLFSQNKLKITFIISLATLTHPLLDALTTGGLGCAFFFPFDNNRYFFPWRPIQVSPIGISKFIGEWGLKVLWSEFLWIGIPTFTILFIKNYFYGNK